MLIKKIRNEENLLTYGNNLQHLFAYICLQNTNLVMGYKIRFYIVAFPVSMKVSKC